MREGRSYKFCAGWCAVDVANVVLPMCQDDMRNDCSDITVR